MPNSAKKKTTKKWEGRKEYKVMDCHGLVNLCNKYLYNTNLTIYRKKRHFQHDNSKETTPITLRFY